MDIKHFFIERGNGDLIILLHGNGENSEYFSSQIDEFSKSYHVYAIDTRGHGKTPRGNLSFTLIQFADDLLQFMNQQNIEKSHILGFSDGGNIALIFTLKYPDRVDKLILNGANLFPTGLKNEVLNHIKQAYLDANRSNDKKNIELLSLMVNEPNISPTELHNIRSKTLVIAGTDDMIDDNHTRLIAENIPNSELKFINGDHFIAAKNPIEYNKTVLNFLKL